jgi:GTPase
VMADLPGLIEGAHEGVGLGIEFLRHIERAGIIVHLVEPMPVDGSDPLINYHAIRFELEQYAAELGTRPEIIVLTKCELPGSDEVHRRLTEALGRPILSASAVTGQNLDKLLWQISAALAEKKQHKIDDEQRAAAKLAALQAPAIADPGTDPAGIIGLGP